MLISPAMIHLCILGTESKENRIYINYLAKLVSFMTGLVHFLQEVVGFVNIMDLVIEPQFRIKELNSNSIYSAP